MSGTGGADDESALARVTALVSGRVQGVGFRYWVREQAVRLGLAGSATNLRDGRVEVVVQGPRADVEALLAALHGTDPPGSVLSVSPTWSEPDPAVDAFRVG